MKNHRYDANSSAFPHALISEFCDNEGMLTQTMLGEGREVCRLMDATISDSAGL
jgi:hypothetical protein